MLSDSNGSVIHYHVGENADGAQLTANSIFLIDSGGQYATGTTDVTRTVHLGIPTQEQVADYTQVLKAHASLASLVCAPSFFFHKANPRYDPLFNIWSYWS